MAPGFSDFLEDTRLSIRSLIEYSESLFNPTVRLGVTGLSRAGKTVFITALVANLLNRGRMPQLKAEAQGRIDGGSGDVWLLSPDIVQQGGITSQGGAGSLRPS